MFNGKLPKTQYFENDPKWGWMEDNVHVLFKLSILILAARRSCEYSPNIDLDKCVPC